MIVGVAALVAGLPLLALLFAAAVIDPLGVLAALGVMLLFVWTLAAWSRARRRRLARDVARIRATFG